jgi:glycosyltransferase involved in cell wall biosynthesis
MLAEPASSAISSERFMGLVTLALPSICIGGAEIVNLTLAKQFLTRGFRVDVVTAEDVSQKFPLPSGARYIVLGARRIRDLIFPFARYLRREQPDAVIASMWPFTSACVLAHRLTRSTARMVVCEHAALSEQYGQRGRPHRLMLKSSIALTYRLAHSRVAVSRGVADDLTELSGIARDTISVIYNPVPVRPEVPADAAAAEAVWGGWRGPRIITVGRFKAQKNHALLIRAFKKMLPMHDARLLILGTGELVEATAAVARAEGVLDKVLMPGETMNPTPYYRSADVFALSSDYEGFGNVIVEALACGVPVVSTNCRSGPSEILENGRYGRLVPVRDADALAQAMIETVVSTHDREALKRRAANFTPELIAEQYLNLLAPKSAGATAEALA